MSDTAPHLPEAVYAIQDEDHDIEVLVTIWPGGYAEYATRPMGSTWSWGAPRGMEKR